MTPEDVGVSESAMVLGKHSGRHAFKDRIKALGYALTDEQLESAFVKFKQLADRKKEVFDDDIEALIDEEIAVAVPREFTLESLHTSSGTTTTPTATVRLKRADGEVIEDAAIGDGPVDATYKTIERITGISGKLTSYRIRAVTSGKEALGEVNLEIENNGVRVRGRAISTDIIEASATAYLNAVNRIIYLSKTKGQAGPAAPSL
jgi:2-isopropylmalate synthase